MLEKRGRLRFLEVAVVEIAEFVVFVALFEVVEIIAKVTVSSSFLFILAIRSQVRAGWLFSHSGGLSS